MRVLFAALLVFAFVTPICITMACSMSDMTPTASGMSHTGEMTQMTAGVNAPTNNHTNHNSLADCMSGFTSHSGLVGTGGLSLAAMLIALAVMGVASAIAPLAAAGTKSWSAPLRVPSPPPPLTPLGVRLSV